MHTLVLNASYEPLKVVTWQRAMTLWAQGKVEVVEAHDRSIRTTSTSYPMSSVVRLLHMVRMRKRPVIAFTRSNIYARDEYTCQYCGAAETPDKLTFDHVIPASQGGTKSWTNIVTCCVPCNRHKDNRTPEQAGLKLLHQPRRPLVLSPAMRLAHNWNTPAAWSSYLYWNQA